MTSSKLPMAEQKLLYTTHPANGGLVFATESIALQSDRLHRALNASSWGELRRALPDSEYRRLEELIREWHDDDSEEDWTSPGDADEFSSSMVPGVDEGEFPPWVQAMNPHPLPPGILQQFGELRTTFVSGDYWHIAPENENAVVAELRAMGYDVRREPALHFY